MERSKKGFIAMLVLTRRLGEEIVIPALDVSIRLLEIRGDKARIGFDGPADVQIHRREVWDRIVESEKLELSAATGI